MKRKMGVGLSELSRRVHLALAQGHIAVIKLVKSEHSDCDEVQAPAPVCSPVWSPVRRSGIPRFISPDWESASR